MKAIIFEGLMLASLEEWQELFSALPVQVSITIAEHCEGEEAVRIADGADIILTNKVVFTEEMLQRLSSNLKYIGVCATGYNVVDVEACKRLNIMVTNVPAYSTMSVAQMIWAHILNITQQITTHVNSVKQGDWYTSKNFSYRNQPLVELEGKYIGILGYGQIGKAVAKIADAFGMKVICTPHKMSQQKTDSFTEFVDKQNLLTQADVLVLCAPLNNETKHFVNSQSLAMMKNTAILINCSRGALVNEDDLYTALTNGSIAASALDVLNQEPAANPNPLINLPNCFITPHNAWYTNEACLRLKHTLIKNIAQWLQTNHCDNDVRS